MQDPNNNDSPKIYTPDGIVPLDSYCFEKCEDCGSIDGDCTHIDTGDCDDCPGFGEHDCCQTYGDYCNDYLADCERAEECDCDDKD